jgi:hypothetical protein
VLRGTLQTVNFNEADAEYLIGNEPGQKTHNLHGHGTLICICNDFSKKLLPLELSNL